MTADYRILDKGALVTLLALIAAALVRTVIARRRLRTTNLKGPSNNSFLFGFSREVFDTTRNSTLFEDWEKQYGSVYQMPSLLGSKHVVLCDPKAVAHFFAKDTFVYRQTSFVTQFLEHFFGRNILWAEADIHKRQRKVLTPAFSMATIRKQISAFYDSAYILKASWDSQLSLAPSGEGVVIDVQKWMNYISLDTIGNAGFSHDFGSLKGRDSAVIAAFDSFGNMKPNAFTMAIFLFAQAFPSLTKIPNKRNAIIKSVGKHVKDIAGQLLEKARLQREANTAEADLDKSIMGTLVRSDSVDSSLHMPYDEIIAQYLLIFAGYETTAITLTWALIELSKNLEEQQKLRTELAQNVQAGDPTWDQINHSLPYLDAIVCETLRLHPPGAETVRQAYEDDIIPISKPIETADGKVVDHITVAKGTTLRIPIMALNCSAELWGADAKQFIPSRWLSDDLSLQKSSEIQGFRHTLTFSDGHRTCLGKVFALTELKTVLSVLIRNYTFEFPGGPATTIGMHRSLLERPKVVGEDGARVPLVVRRIE